MSFLDKMKASVGMDTASVEVDVQQRPSKRGDTFRALAHVKPGKTRQKLRYLRVSFEYEGTWYVPSVDGLQIMIEGKGRIWYGDWPNSTDVMLEPGAVLHFPIELRVPTDSPISGDKLKYKFFLRADIDDAKDPEFSLHFDVA